MWLDEAMSLDHPCPTSHREHLEDFLSTDDLMLWEPMEESAWHKLRMRGVFDLLRYFINWRDLRMDRTVFPVIAGYAWSGIYRSMLVPAISAASFKNEGHFRARKRTSGTENFFGAVFRYSPSSPVVRQAIRMVNVRHHVAGIVIRRDGDVEVIRHYEPAYTYVSTAFIEGIRRGYASCGVPADSKEGLRIAEDLCTIFYQIAGMVGLKHVPKNLAAHEKFRDAYEAHLRSHPRSEWVKTQARELAKRIFPFTAAQGGNTMEDQLNRFLDRETAEYLFPDPTVLEQLKPVYDTLKTRFSASRKGYGRALVRQLFFRPPPPDEMKDLDPLWEAYCDAPDNSTEARLIGAVLLHAHETREDDYRWHFPQTIHLSAGEALFRQGERHDHCYILLETSQPLIVTRHVATPEGESPEVEILRLQAPTLLGEIGMWRGTPAIATVSCESPTELRVLRLDQRDFDALKANPGFWAAAAATVQRRLRVSMKSIMRMLDHKESHRHDEALVPILQLLHYVTGDTTANLDLVPGIDAESNLGECIDILRQLASDLHEARRDDAHLRVAMEDLLQVIG